MRWILTISVLFCLLLTQACSKTQLELGPQRCEIVFAKLLPGTNTLRVGEGSDYITPEELRLLQSNGISGELRATGIRQLGEGDNKAHVLVIMSSYVRIPVDLRQPDATNAIYLQRGQSFLLIPNNTPTIKKSVRLESRLDPMNTNRFETDFSVDMGSVTQGGTAILW